jgi:hypothetical protein
METESNKNIKQQNPVETNLEAIARKQLEMDQKPDRILAIIDPKPEPKETIIENPTHKRHWTPTHPSGSWKGGK